MGVDYNAVKLLVWSKKLGVSFERTATLGHQGFDCAARQLRHVLSDFGFPASEPDLERCFERPPMGGIYADNFLRLLGAKEIVSIDYSDFEGATLLHDLNEPFPEAQRARFTFVHDGGTLEHIFNYPAALRHTLELVALGGHFLTVAPGHSSMGHGFYQISPELFFRVFSADNGFELRKIVLYPCIKRDAPFYEVKDPAVTGYRTDLISRQPMILAALARRTALKPILARPPMQSDYAAHWETHRQRTAAANGSATGLLWRVRTALNPYWPHWLRRWRQSLHFRRCAGGRPSLRNPNHFRRLSYRELCGQDGRG
jgi:hypothetical protein